MGPSSDGLAPTFYGTISSLADCCVSDVDSAYQQLKENERRRLQAVAQDGEKARSDRTKTSALRQLRSFHNRPFCEEQQQACPAEHSFREILTLQGA
jgi:hypothetical protein